MKAAQTVSEQLGVPIEPFVIGPGRELDDLYGDWAGRAEIPDDGCLLVRPDAHIGWRSHDLLDAVAAELERVIRSILAVPAASADHAMSAA